MAPVPARRPALQGVGQPVLRKEDERLVTGAGCYSDDFVLPGQAHAAFVRSPHAHARIQKIDLADAPAPPGVIEVLTGHDAVADGLQPIPHRPVPSNPHEVPLRSRNGSAFFIAPHPPLPADRARFVGEAVAMVIAETPAIARDAAERVVVAYDPLPAGAGTLEAPAAGAALVWDDAGSNVCVDSIAGDAAAVDAAFARAAHVVRLDTQVNRVTGAPMDPRAALGAWDTATGRFAVYAGSGGSWRIRSDVAGVLGVPEASIRVVARDVGGNYGTRNSCYPEHALVAWAARRLGRPVKWTGDRREMLLTDYQSRDLVSQMELALDAEGNFLAVRGTNTSNVGAHAVSFIPLAKGVAVSTSVYHVPLSSMRGRAVLSHTAPTTPYHAVGRPGSRDELRPARRRMARCRPRAGPADHRRYRPRSRRRRLPLRPLDAARRRRDVEGHRADRRERPAPHGVAARGGRGRRRAFRAPFSREGHRSLDRPVRGCGRCATTRCAG